MQVDTKNDIYTKQIGIWERTRDGISGQDAVKDKRKEYLPQLNGQDDNAYNGYLSRAQYINYSGRTINVALGQLFRKQPILNEVDDDIQKNINLSGQSFIYFSRELAQEVMTTNRQGVLIDWSDEAGRPYLVQYKAEEIINWRTKIEDGEHRLTLVVLEGIIEVENKQDYFKSDKIKVWRVLELTDGVYKMSMYVKKDGDFVKIENEKTNEDGDIIPLKDGQPLDFIPFYFVTSNGIKINVEESIMYDFVNVNLGHYKNSADYENMLHWTGAKSPVIKGWEKEDPVPIGGAIALPIDGDASFLEASSDSGLKDEMRHKEEQMAAMGTVIISGQGRYVASAETARISSEGEYATLSDIAEGLSDAMTIIMKELVEWQGQDSKDVLARYNKDYQHAPADPAYIQTLTGLFQGGFISDTTYYYNMERAEIYPPGWTMDDEKARIEETQEEIGEVIDEEQEDDSLPETTDKAVE